MTIARIGATLALLCSVMISMSGQQAGTYKAPRSGDGHPDLQGLWEARNTASGSLEAHTADRGIRAGNSVIVEPADGKIPYKAEARTKQIENFNTRATADPMNKCFIPGVPRMMYIPYPFQIFQTPTQISIASEFGHTIRNVYFTKKGHYAEAEFWIGDSRGRWEGETLVVDNGNFNDQTWLDASGNHHSTELNVLERFTRTAEDTLMYEATITDPQTYTRPWTIRMPLYLHREPDAQLFEYECHAYPAADEKPEKSK